MLNQVHTITHRSEAYGDDNSISYYAGVTLQFACKWEVNVNRNPTLWYWNFIPFISQRYVVKRNNWEAKKNRRWNIGFEHYKLPLDMALWRWEPFWFYFAITYEHIVAISRGWVEFCSSSFGGSYDESKTQKYNFLKNSS